LLSFDTNNFEDFMKALIISVTIAAFALFSSCSDDSLSNSAKQTYKYTGYDSSWNKIITGYLWIDSIDSIEVKGRWDFDPVSNGENFGPQIGKGILIGSVHPLGLMTLNLNPGMVDNNVILDGSLRLPYRFDGLWSYIGFLGEINWGRFEATQIR
jgi:hypothetical protein